MTDYTWVQQKRASFATQEESDEWEREFSLDPGPEPEIVAVPVVEAWPEEVPF